MSYKVEIMDEYSFGQWLSNSLRFATESEATQYSHSFLWGWSGILDLRVVPSDDAVNARWTENRVTDHNGQPLRRPSPPPSMDEIREEAKNLSAAWDAIVDRLDTSSTRKKGHD